jgi:hypothetical protein
MDDILSENVVQLHLQNSDKVSGHVPPVAGGRPVTPRFLIRSEWMMKLGQQVKNWKRRFFILLDNGSITYYKVCLSV